MNWGLLAAECPVRDFCQLRRSARGFDGLDDAGDAERLATIHVKACELDILVMRLEKLGELARVVDLGHDHHALVLEERVNLACSQRPQQSRGQRMRCNAFGLE